MLTPLAAGQNKNSTCFGVDRKSQRDGQTINRKLTGPYKAAANGKAQLGGVSSRDSQNQIKQSNPGAASHNCSSAFNGDKSLCKNLKLKVNVDKNN